MEVCVHGRIFAIPQPGCSAADDFREFRSNEFCLWSGSFEGPAPRNASRKLGTCLGWWRDCVEMGPRRQMMIHGSRASYLAAVGQAGRQTSGCSFIQLDAGKVISRRIDLLVDPTGAFPALPHELTHVILADRFRGRQPPHWLDEGVAMLADTQPKQLLHDRDCREANRRGTALPIGEILHLQQFTSADQMPAFYGQSLSLVRMLSARKKPESLIPFALDASRSGLRKCIETTLQHQWNWRSPARMANILDADGSRSVSLPVVEVSFKPEVRHLPLVDD